MWKVLNKEVDLGEPTSFLDHVYLDCTQRQCQISKGIVDNDRTMFESRISVRGAEKIPFPQNLRISSWCYDMVGHAKKCVELYCELANKTTQQLYKVSTPCIDDHHFKEEEMKSVGELSQVCSQIVLKWLYLARIGRPDILWSKTRQCMAGYVEASLMHRNAIRSKSGQSRNQSSKMREKHEVSSLLNQRMKNSNMKTFVESWKFRCQQQCLVKHQQMTAVKPAAVLENT